MREERPTARLSTAPNRSVAKVVLTFERHAGDATSVHVNAPWFQSAQFGRVRFANQKEPEPENPFS